MLKENEIFDTKYRVIKVIGQGGMGRVYKAEHNTLKNMWAIKEMLFDKDGPIDLLAEPNILKQLSHPALPRIVDVVEDKNKIFIVMDYVDGMTLKEALEKKGKFSEDEVIDIAKQLCEVLNYLHNHKPKPIIYRDMKPGNVMITKDGRIIVIDFGIAREYKEDSVQDTVLGYSPGYAAPEQQNSQVQSDVRTDIYSLGVTLFHLVTGKSPFEPPYEFSNVRKIDDSLSEGIETIIRKCVQSNPENRYQDIMDVLLDLRNIKKLNAGYKKEKRNYILKKSMCLIGLLFSIYIIFYGYKVLGNEIYDDYKSYIEKGIGLENESKYDEAIKNYEQAIELFPDEVEGRVLIAKTYLDMLDNEGCVNYINNETLNNMVLFKDSELNYVLGTAYFNLKDYTNAEKYFAKAVSIKPEDILYNRDLAVCLGKQNNIEEAENIISKVKNITGEDNTVSFLKGEICIIKEEYEEAVQYFQKSIENCNDNELKLRAYKTLASIYEDNLVKDDNRYSKEIEILEKAINDIGDKNDLQLTEMLGSAYFNKGLELKKNNSEYSDELNKSVECFQSLLDRGYKMPYIYSNIGNIYHYLKLYDKGEAIFKEMVELYPEDVSGYVYLALLYADMENDKKDINRDYTKVVECYNLAIKYSENEGETPKLKQLSTLIDQLKANGWIK